MSDFSERYRSKSLLKKNRYTSGDWTITRRDCTGKRGLKIVHPDILVTDFSEIGVILLMFLAGIESNLPLLRKYFRPGVFVALLGILFPLLLGTGSGSLFGVPMNQSFFFGLVLAATSVSISVEVLKELKVVNTKKAQRFSVLLWLTIFW